MDAASLSYRTCFFSSFVVFIELCGLLPILGDRLLQIFKKTISRQITDAFSSIQFSHDLMFMLRLIAQENLGNPVILFFSEGVSVGRADVCSILLVSNDY